MKNQMIDWSSLNTRQQIKYLEIEGFVVFPEVLSPDQLQEIRIEVSKLPTTAVDYSESQRYYENVQWTDSPQCINLIAMPEILAFLETLFGDEIICTSYNYALSRPGHPGISLHTDAQPYGSKIFGNQASAPRLVRILYYLDDLTPEKAPFKVIPHSHLSLHADGNPYHRYKSHPEEIMITCKAGTAVIINQSVFHGNFPNRTRDDRRMLAIAYRPAWAGPVYEVEDRLPEKVAKLPSHVRPLFKSLNTRKTNYNVPNRFKNMPTEAQGINPSRWNC